jgi:hypothetical protein
MKNLRSLNFRQLVISQACAQCIADLVSKNSFQIEELFLPHSTWEDEEALVDIVRLQTSNCPMISFEVGKVLKSTAS